MSSGASHPDRDPVPVSATAEVRSPRSLPPASSPTGLARGRLLLVGVGLGLALAFLGGRLLAPGSTTESAEAPTPVAEPAEAGPSPAITVATAELATVARTLAATGSVQAYELLPVTAQAGGLRIERVLVEEGQMVQAGQPLALFDNSLLQAQRQQALAAVQQAEARLAELRAGARTEERARVQEAVRSAEAGVAQARSDLDLVNKRLERNQLLQAEGAIAQDRLDEVRNQQRTAQAALEQATARLQDTRASLQEVQAGPRPETIAQAQAELAQARAQVQLIDTQLRDTRLLAPRAGLIATRFAQVGDTTATSAPLFELIQDGRLEVQLTVPETELPQIRLGQTVRLRSDANPDLTITGRVRAIEPLVRAESRQAIVKVDVPSSGLRPGMFVQGEIVVATAAGVTVPAAAVLPQPDGSSRVFVVQADETVRATTVEMGELLRADQVEIRSGLAPGDRVALKGAPYLQDGERIKIASESLLPEPAPLPNDG